MGGEDLDLDADADVVRGAASGAGSTGDDLSTDDTGTIERRGTAAGAPVEWEADVVLRDGAVAHVRPIMPARRRRRPPLPRAAVRRVHLPALLRAAAAAERQRDVAPLHPRRLRRPGGAGRDARRRDHRASRRYDRMDADDAPRSPSTSPTPTRAGASARSCSSTWQPSPRSAASPASSPRCCRRTARCSRSSARPATRSATTSRTASIAVRFDIQPTEQLRGRATLARAPRRGPEHAHHAVPGVDRGRSAPAGGQDSIGAIGCWPTSSPPASRGGSTPSTPRPTEVQGLQAYPRVTRRPRPRRPRGRRRPGRARSLEVVQDCARGRRQGAARGVGRLRRGRAGRAQLQRELLPARRASAGMRVVGPNSFGVINTDPDVRLNASLARRCPRRGRLGPVRPERRAGYRGARLRCPPQPRHLDLRLGGQPGRRLRQRLHAVLDRRRGHRRRRPLPGVDGQPAQVLADRPSARASSSRSSWSSPGSLVSACRPATGSAPPTCRPGAFDAHAAAGGRDPGRERPPALRRRPAPGPPAAAGRRPGRHRRQLRRARRARPPSACVSWGLEVDARAGVAAARGQSPAEFATALDAAFADPEVDTVVAASSRRSSPRTRRCHRRPRRRRQAREALRRNLPRHARGRRRARP